MMKMVKPILMIFITMLICCTCSLGLSPVVIGNGGISGGVPGTIGMINDGSGVFPINGISNGMANLAGNLPGHMVTLHEFVCNSMSACGEYPLGLADNSDGANVFPVAHSGAIVSGIEGSAVKIV